MSSVPYRVEKCWNWKSCSHRAGTLNRRTNWRHFIKFVVWKWLLFTSCGELPLYKNSSCQFSPEQKCFMSGAWAAQAQTSIGLVQRVLISQCFLLRWLLRISSNLMPIRAFLYLVMDLNITCRQQLTDFYGTGYDRHDVGAQPEKSETYFL